MFTSEFTDKRQNVDEADAAADPGLNLRCEIGALAHRLAEFLAAAVPESGGVIAESRRFLLAQDYPPSEPWGETHANGPLDRLVKGLSLSDLEKDLLVLAGAPDHHEGFAQVFSTLHPQDRPRPTAALAAQLFCCDEEERRALRRTLETGAASASGLLRLDGEAPFLMRDLFLADAVWPVLMGIDRWPSRLRPLSAPPALDGLEAWLAGPAAASVHALTRRIPCTVLVTDDELERAFARAGAIAQFAGAPYVQLEFPQESNEELEQLCQLHALARGISPVIRLGAAYAPTAAKAPAFSWLAAPVVVAARQGMVELHGARPLIGVSCDRLRMSDLTQMWRRVLPQQAQHAALLAARYPVEPFLASQVAADVNHAALAEKRPPELSDVAASIRTRTGAQLRSGVKLVRPTATWQRLVLPPDRRAQLQEAVDRLVHQYQVLDQWRFLEDRHGARGVRMLFAGPPGAGKTLAAEVLASALQVDLLVVDLSRVVSKWIGETEKNLAEVFDTAERARAVLLFDEADALFGKRTEISDAHDRYSNLETSYLLARLERFEGLTILSTNLRQNIDPAFTRRLEFIVEFDPPDRDQRLSLWERHVPDAGLLAEDVDLAELATVYPLVGGLIRNAAVAAAFLAAAEDAARGACRRDRARITRAHLIRAIKREYEKTGQAFPGFPAGMTEV